VFSNFKLKAATQSSSHQVIMSWELPDEDILDQFVICNETKGRRLSKGQRSYNFDVKFGPTTLIQNVDAAIMASESWFIQRFICTQVTELSIKKALGDYLSNFKVNGTQCLISLAYLNAFFSLMATAQESFLRKTARIYRKCISDQIEWIHTIFRNAPQYAVNHALHNYILGEVRPRRCANSPCKACDRQGSERDQIFWFIQSGFVVCAFHMLAPVLCNV